MFKVPKNNDPCVDIIRAHCQLTLTGREPCYCGFIVPTPSGGNRDITFYNSYVYMHEITQ